MQKWVSSLYHFFVNALLDRPGDMSIRKRMTFDAFEESLNSGDVVLLSGKQCASRAIRCATQSKLSHIGIAIRHRENKKIYVYHSDKALCQGGLPESERIDGPVLVLLSDLVLGQEYRYCSIRPISIPFTESEVAAFREEFHRQWRHLKYERNPCELVRAVVDNLCWCLKNLNWFKTTSMYRSFEQLVRNSPNSTSLFCSEFVVHTLQFLGRMSSSLVANEYIPSDFLPVSADRLWTVSSVHRDSISSIYEKKMYEIDMDKLNFNKENIFIKTISADSVFRK